MTAAKPAARRPLLEALPSSPAAAERQARIAAEIVKGVLESPEFQSMIDNKVVYERLGQGLNLREALDVSKEQMEAIYAVAHRLLSAGETAKARDVLLRLVQLDPLDERFLYLLGVCMQLEGKLSAAAQLYVRFLALDATNPDGYLRLGECFLANEELDQAQEVLELAKAMAADQPARADVAPHADSMLAAVAARRAAA